MRRFLERDTKKLYDFIVIGGGITGAAVAYEAASRGLSVALIEKQDFGCATSAATSKLIHGGARYLANLEFGLVRESLRERRILANIAPNFVYPIPIMNTTYKTDRLLKVGMILYDLLSYGKSNTWDKSKRIPFHRTIPPDEAVELEPIVKREGLTGAHIFYDCVSIAPERLTLAFIRSAVSCGAHVSNYAKAEGFLFANKGTLCGVRVRDLIHDKQIELKGRLTINCGGPWADVILGMAGGHESSRSIIRSEGIHLITRKLADKHMISLPDSKGGSFFLIPWRGHTLIGLTDKEYLGSPDEYRVTKKSILEFLDTLNGYFRPGFSLTYEDVLYAYGGLRPLVESKTTDVKKMSRRYEILDNAKNGIDGLVTVEGGKYTTSRRLAVSAMKTVARKLGRDLGKSNTHSRHLVGSEIKDLRDFMSKIKRETSDLDETTVEWLGRNYGTEYEKVVSLAKQDETLAVPLNDDGEILAQVVYAIRNEMAMTLKDIVFRRTGIGTLGDPGADTMNRVAAVAAAEFSWDEHRKQQEIAEVTRAHTLPQ